MTSAALLDYLALPADARVALFRALAEARNSGLSVADSRAAVAAQFAVPGDVVRAAEREGLENDWPPL